MLREKKTLSGPLLEIDIYPVTSDGRRYGTRAPRTMPSTEAQKKYNQQMATKKLIRLVNTNFGKDDYLVHPTYRSDLAPQTEEEARRDVVNYLRRVKWKREKELTSKKKERSELQNILNIMPGAKHIRNRAAELDRSIKKLSLPFKYIYVIEKQVYKTGARQGRANWHFHLFVSGGLDRDTLEGLWPYKINADVYRPDKFGPEAAARYLAKDPQGAKRFSYSKNLEKPKEKIKDGALSRYGAERIAKQRVDDAAYWERRHKGYKFVRCYARYNEYNAHWYVSAIMYRADGTAPPWEDEDDDWLL